MKDRVFPRGVRPVALQAVSERERLKACPHRAQAAVNLARALTQQATLAPESLPAAENLTADVVDPKPEQPKKARRKR